MRHTRDEMALYPDLFDSQQAICRESREVIALTASPMQQRGYDLLGVFSMMGGELEEYSSGWDKCSQEIGREIRNELTRLLSRALI